MRTRSEGRPAVEAPVKARSMLFDLYGDFALEDGRDGTLRLSAIVRLAGGLGVRESAVRSAAARLIADGWLVAQRRGRESVYALSARGRALIEQGRPRIFDVPDPTWDGAWYVVALSVPEARREVRDRMRKELAWLGFGSPSSGLYVSPRDRCPELLALAEELRAGEYVQVYRATALWPADPKELVARAWGGLGEVDRRYAAFVRRFEGVYAADRARALDGALCAPDAFRTRFHLANQFRKCLFGDPDLPPELRPAGWHGVAARRLFLAYHALVTPPALAHFDAMSGRREDRAGRTPAAG